MLLQIKNIGAIERAEVILDGLTVIGGENDTGKSTVGKLLFAIIKGIARYEQDLNESKEQNLKKLVEEIYFLARSSFSKQIANAFSPPQFNREIRAAIGLSAILFEDFVGIEELVQKKIELVKTQRAGPEIQEAGPMYESKALERLIGKLGDLKALASRVEDRTTIIRRALKKALNSEFYAELSPKQHPKSLSEINLSEGESPIFEIRLRNNEIEEFDLKDLVVFEDVTFIETPVILQMYEVIRNANTLLELESDDKEERLKSLHRPKVSLHLKDLIAKIENSRISLPGENPMEVAVLEKIEAMIGGSFSFEKEIRDFVFNKKHNSHSRKMPVRSVNTASGIKSFGLIQLLLQGRFIDNRSLLIIDEPETHLHPKWQVEYARILVELVKNEIPVLVTSHSPYLIQALKVFSEKEGIAPNTHFYMAQRKEGAGPAQINEVTDDLNQLFLKLSEPLQKLVWE